MGFSLLDRYEFYCLGRKQSGLIKLDRDRDGDRTRLISIRWRMLYCLQKPGSTYRFRKVCPFRQQSTGTTPWLYIVQSCRFVSSPTKSYDWAHVSWNNWDHPKDVPNNYHYLFSLVSCLGYNITNGIWHMWIVDYSLR